MSHRGNPNLFLDRSSRRKTESIHRPRMKKKRKKNGSKSRSARNRLPSKFRAFSLRVKHEEDQLGRSEGPKGREGIPRAAISTESLGVMDMNLIKIRIF